MNKKRGIIKTDILSLSKGVAQTIEKNVRCSILKRVESVLKKELATVQSQINRLTGEMVKTGARLGKRELKPGSQKRVCVS